MTKKVTVILLAAAAVVVGIIIWKRMRVAAPAGAGTPAPPDIIPLPAQLSNAFSTLIQQGTNQVSQWFSSQLSGASQGKIVAEKPAPVASKGPNVSVPAASTPNPVDRPTYLA